MNTLLQVDERDVETKYVTAETRYIGQGVATVGDGKAHMHNEGPSTSGQSDTRKQRRVGIHPNPAHKREIIGSSTGNDVVDCVVKDGDRTYMVSGQSRIRY